MKNIFVNATAATEGGILTILNQFISSVGKYNINGYKYFVFSSVNIKCESSDIRLITNIKAKKKLDRIKWDLRNMKKWAVRHEVKPDLIVSLQSTGVKFKGVPQLVYIHQSLPYSEESNWSIFKKDERKYWFYRYLFKIWINLTVKGKAKVVVQTNWMKEALINNSFKKEDILVSLPNVNDINIGTIKPIRKEKKYLFYPAAEYKYKNHDILVEAVKNLNTMKNNTELSFKIVLTLGEDSALHRKVNELGLNKYFEFIGQTSFVDVLSLYKGCQAILFPSYIETVGLPLIEGSAFGKRILVADCEYSREILSDYKLASFIPYSDVKEWEEEIKKSLSYYEEKPNDFEHKTGWENVFNLINHLSNI